MIMGEVHRIKTSHDTETRGNAKGRSRKPLAEVIL